MRSREQIIESVNRKGFHTHIDLDNPENSHCEAPLSNERAILEILLDIRDLLYTESMK